MVQKFPKGKEGVEVCIARPGVIANSTTWSRALVANLFRIINRFGRTLPSIQRSELAAAVLNQARDGIEKRTLLNADLVRLGRRELKFRSAPRLSWISRGRSMDPAVALCLSSWLLEPMNLDITSAGIGMGFWNSTNISLYQEAQLTIDRVWLCLCLFMTWNNTIPYYKGGVGGNPPGESFFIMASLVLKNRTNSEVRKLWSK